MSVSNGWCIVNESLGNKMLPTRKIFVTDMSVFLFIHSLNMLTITVEEYMIAVVSSCRNTKDLVFINTHRRVYKPKKL